MNLLFTTMSDVLPPELDPARQLLQVESYGPKAIAALAQQGSYEAAFEQLWTETNGPPQIFTTPGEDDRSLWQIILNRLRQEICGDDSFRSQVKEYKKNPTSAPLLTGLVMYLVGLAGLPIPPEIATVVVLYILHIGLDVFCEYTAPRQGLPPGAE